MFLKRFYDETLAQASYLIGCPTAGEAIVVDPNRDIEQYVACAAAERLRITAVTETHIHADFVSGARDLARATGASLLLSGEGGTYWSYGFAVDDGARLLHDGDEFTVGAVRIRALHTPGHTPEHLSFLVTDGAASDKPMALLTGDFVFAGDVGRPDLLERAARVEGSMVSSARQLFQSLQRLRALPDYLQLWPGHAAGSACGKSLSALPSTTLGFERLANWAFQIADEELFVTQALEGQPEVPRYFALMKTVNRDGPAPGPTTFIDALDVEAARAAVDAGAVMLDVRPTSEYAARHVSGSIAVPFGRSFTNYAGAVLSYENDFVILAHDEREATRVRRALALIGIDRVAGWTPASGLDEWATHGAVDTLPQVDAPTASSGSAGRILDVRGAAEWEAGHVPGSRRAYFGHLPDAVADIPRDTPIVLHCGSGSRSVIAASVLRRAGYRNVRNLTGGIQAWRDAGLPIEK